MDNTFITIVSGLPRSGTSMMMQAIEAGGLPVLCDHIRSEDDDNPRGYYEFEPVKKTKTDPSWVPGARGMVVKAFVVLRPGFEADAAMVRTLQDFAKQTIAPYKYPRQIELRARLPRTETGKLQRFRLRDAA